MNLVRYSVDGKLGRIYLNRPAKRNALNSELIADLRTALAKAEENSGLTCLVLSAEGADFCAGLDLAELNTNAEQSELERVTAAENLAQVFLAIRRHPLPVAALLRGRALGGGAGLITSCDLVLAAASSSLGYPEVQFGFIPAMVAALVKDQVPRARLFDILSSGNLLTAQDAAAYGLISQVFPDEEFEKNSAVYLNALTNKSASALRRLKKLLNVTEPLTLEQALAEGVRENARARGDADAKAGIRGFIER